MTLSLITKAKCVAMNNGEPFHLAAMLWRGKSLVRIGTNQEKTHPYFHRKYKNGSAHNLHAEMDVLRFAKPGDTIVVMRWSAKGELTMAKPCPYCHKFIKEAGITEVTYSDWDGEMKTLYMENE
jgi:deoxycytidylate deaminase